MYHINVNIIRIYPVSQIMSRTNRERKFQGANWPGSYWPIRSRERIGPGAKRLWIKIQIALDWRINQSYKTIQFQCTLYNVHFLVQIHLTSDNVGSSRHLRIPQNIHLYAENLCNGNSAKYFTHYALRYSANYKHPRSTCPRSLAWPLNSITRVYWYQ